MGKSRIGILGAGKLGLALAKLGAEAGYEVWIASRKPAEKNALAVEILAPGAKVKNVSDILTEMPVILLAIPLSNYPSLPKEQLAGKLVIDAMNYWWEVDGTSKTYSTVEETSSERVQNILTKAELSRHSTIWVIMMFKTKLGRLVHQPEKPWQSLVMIRNLCLKRPKSLTTLALIR